MPEMLGVQQQPTQQSAAVTPLLARHAMVVRGWSRKRFVFVEDPKTSVLQRTHPGESNSELLLHGVGSLHQQTRPITPACSPTPVYFTTPSYGFSASHHPPFR